MIPWFVKIPAKMLLSRAPIRREWFNRVGMFRHGSMVRPDYALEIVRRHSLTAGIDLSGKTVLELGPGDSVGNGIVAYALGASSSILVDAGRFASRSPRVYRDFIDWLITTLPESSRLRDAAAAWTTFEELLGVCRISYLTEGLRSLQSIPDGTVDYAFSEAVLEHVRLNDFGATVAELRRCMKDTAVATHVVDYKDHLESGLNNMRFSVALWEAPLFARSGFYTNRLRHSDVLAAFTSAGFRITADEVVRWPAAPLARSRITPGLRHYSDDDLRIREATVVLRPN